jgi:molybdate transport system substrate-binding protein
MTTLLALLLVSRSSTIRVFAASSLKEAFTAIARGYESSHPGVKVSLNFGGSQLLAAQINHGAPADVFASAAKKNLDSASYDRDTYRVFAQNRLAIVVRQGLYGIWSPRQLDRAERIVIADPAVPAGAYSQQFFIKASRQFGAEWLRKVQSKVVSKEQDVKAVLAKVRLGEADAGIVYESDLSASELGKVTIPDPLNVLADYPVAVLNGSPNRQGAINFTKYLLGPTAQQDLETYGLISPMVGKSQIFVVNGGKSRAIAAPLPKVYKAVVVDAVGHEGKPRSYFGVPVMKVIGPTTAREATFVAADAYRRTISIATLRSSKAILVWNPDGNLQLIVPGQKPSFWVRAVRRIELR